jgi:hypothetical protein
VRGEVFRGLWWENLREKRHRRRWENNIKMDLQEVGCGLDRAGGNELSGCMKCGEFLE